MVTNIGGPDPSTDYRNDRRPAGIGQRDRPARSGFRILQSNRWRFRPLCIVCCGVIHRRLFAAWRQSRDRLAGFRQIDSAPLDHLVARLHVFELDRVFATVAVIQAALPSGVPVFVLAQHYQSFVTRSSAAIAISTAVSLLTMSALFLILFL